MQSRQKETFLGDTSEVAYYGSDWRRFIKVFLGRKIVILGFTTILLLIISAIFAPSIAPYDPYKQNLAQALEKPSNQHWLGTDWLGRDLLSRIIFGTRTSLQVGVIAVGIAAMCGMTLGSIAGYFGGWLNTIIMRFMDSLMAIPPIVLTLALGATLGGGLRMVMVALGIALVPVYARVMCGQVLSVRENDYILAGQVIGASSARIILRHIIPNCFPAFIVLVTLNMGTAILIEAGLSFLGLGIAPPGAAWGSMVNDGYRYLITHPLVSFAPGLCIMLVVLSFNLVGDGLRDALDPRLRGKI